MKGERRSEKQKSNLVTVSEMIDTDRLTNVRVELRKISLDQLGPGGSVKLTKEPFVRLRKVQVPSRLLTELKKKYSLGETYRTKLKVKVVDDDEIDQIKETQAEQRKKTEKLKVRVVQDCQIVVIEEISRYDCVSQQKTQEFKQIISGVQVKCSEKISVSTVSDADSRSIRDIGQQQSLTKPVRRLERALRYLKPSKTVDNYGLGGKAEIDRDDVERPIKQIPLWAEERNYLEQMSSQAEVDTAMIFAVCDPPDMKEIFPNSSNIGTIWETPPQTNKSKKIPKEKNDHRLEYFSRSLLTSFCSP